MINKQNIEQNKEEKKEKKAKPIISLADAATAYNTMAKKNNLPFVSELDDKRKRLLHNRLASLGDQGWSVLLSKISGSSFLKGENPRGWRVTFDWIIKKSNCLKILEDNYESKPKQSAMAGKIRTNHGNNQPSPEPSTNDWREQLIQQGMSRLDNHDGTSSGKKLAALAELKNRGYFKSVSSLIRGNTNVGNPCSASA